MFSQGPEVKKIDIRKRMIEVDFDGITKAVGQHLKEEKSAPNAPSVLILGNPSAGKSTFVNFMTGSPMEVSFSDSGDEILLPKDKREPPCYVSHDPVLPATLLPQFVPSGHKLESKDFFYIDCAGVPPSGNLPARDLTSTILTQLAIQKTEKITGVIFLISHQSLRGKANDFVNFFEGLEKSITELSKQSHSVLFLVTQ